MIAHTRLQTMLLVDALDERVGAWPTSILKVLFAFDPHMPFSLHLFTRVIAFMFGNCVPLPMACFFFSARSFLPPHLVTPRFSYLYSDWSLFPSNTTRFPYYMYEKKVEIRGWHDRPPHFTTGEPAGAGRGRLDITCTFLLIKVF